MDSDMSPFVVRIPEQAIRLATILAAGRQGPSALVTIHDMQWGAGLSRTAGLAVAEKVLGHVPGNDRSEISAKIASYIRRKAKETQEPVLVKHVQQFLKSTLKSPEIRGIVAQLVERGEIQVAGGGYKGGRP
jgi:hypothetical protein